MEDPQHPDKPQQSPHPRSGWDEAFRRMAAAGDDELLIDDILPDEDFPEWEPA